MYYSLLQLFEQNQDALLALPSEAKTILMISVIILFGSSLVRKAWKLAKIVAVVAIVYFACTYIGLI